MKCCFVFSYLFAWLFHPSHAAPEVADLIIRDARVITVDQKYSVAQAIAIKGDKILAVDDDQHIANFQGTGTRVVDAHRQDGDAWACMIAMFIRIRLR